MNHSIPIIAALLASLVLGRSPIGFPPVPVPTEDLPTPAKIALGESLFHDARLSSNGAVSCSSCHVPERAFCDGLPVAVGVNGAAGTLNTPTLLNSAYLSQFFWDGRTASLEDQVLYPITHPREMNMTKSKVIELLRADPAYRVRFEAAFGEQPITFPLVGRAIAAYERTLISGDSAFDRYYFNGDVTGMSAAAVRGWQLFRGRAGCISCHVFRDDRPFFADGEFHNMGIGWNRDFPDLGRYHVTREPDDRGRFRTPSLRNVARTAPYMHDGRFATLEEVIAHYARGGIPNPYLDSRLRPIVLSDGERHELVEFLRSLNGTEAAPQRAGAPEVMR